MRTTPAALTPDTRLREELGADSLDIIVLACELEDRFGREVPDEVLDRVRTVGDLLRLLDAEATRQSDLAERTT